MLVSCKSLTPSFIGLQELQVPSEYAPCSHEFGDSILSVAPFVGSFTLDGVFTEDDLDKSDSESASAAAAAADNEQQTAASVSVSVLEQKSEELFAATQVGHFDLTEESSDAGDVDASGAAVAAAGMRYTDSEGAGAGAGMGDTDSDSEVAGSESRRVAIKAERIHDAEELPPPMRRRISEAGVIAQGTSPALPASLPTTAGGVAARELQTLLKEAYSAGYRDGLRDGGSMKSALVDSAAMAQHDFSAGRCVPRIDSDTRAARLKELGPIRVNFPRGVGEVRRVAEGRARRSLPNVKKKGGKYFGYAKFRGHPAFSGPLRDTAAEAAADVQKKRAELNIRERERPKTKYAGVTNEKRRLRVKVFLSRLNKELVLTVGMGLHETAALIADEIWRAYYVVSKEAAVAVRDAMKERIAEVNAAAAGSDKGASLIRRIAEAATTGRRCCLPADDR